MKRATLITCGVACAGVLGTVANSGADATATPATVHLVGQQISESSPRRPHPGSIVVFSGRETGDDSGHSYVHCIVIDRVRALCTGQFVLAHGTLSVQTAIRDVAPKTIFLTITGGTGAYDGARGTARFTDIGKDKTDEVFTFKQ
jgi:hypothetical protein